MTHPDESALDADVRTALSSVSALPVASKNAETVESAEVKARLLNAMNAYITAQLGECPSSERIVKVLASPMLAELFNVDSLGQDDINAVIKFFPAEQLDVAVGLVDKGLGLLALEYADVNLSSDLQGSLLKRLMATGNAPLLLKQSWCADWITPVTLKQLLDQDVKTTIELLCNTNTEHYALYSDPEARLAIIGAAATFIPTESALHVIEHLAEVHPMNSDEYILLLQQSPPSDKVIMLLSFCSDLDERVVSALRSRGEAFNIKDEILWFTPEARRVAGIDDEE